MDTPPMAFDARRTKQGSIAQGYGFVFDRPQKAFRQGPGFRPGNTPIFRPDQPSFPFGRTRPDLIEQQQIASRYRIQHRVPAGISQGIVLNTIGYIDRRRPMSGPLILSAYIDADIRVSLFRAAKKSRYQSARRLRDRRRMTFGKRCGIIQKLTPDNRP